MTGAEKLSPPFVDLASRTWLWLSGFVAFALKFMNATYSVPSGAVKGCENWFALHVPCAVAAPCAFVHSGLVPLTKGLGLRKIWVATIDYTPDHLPILGPALLPDGSAIEGVTVASPGGHGMMWGPGVARVAADLALRGTTDLIDVTDLGLDRFDEHGVSRLATDPIALPFPLVADDDEVPLASR